MSNDRKSETLGIPHGTASNRLRKLLLFRQLKKHNENICARCNKEIEHVDELSVEHIKPWEGISADLFWDLDNVAFSHMFCNRPHRFVPRPKANLVPEGTSWCSGCKKPVDVVLFDKNETKKSGLQTYCKSCKAVYKQNNKV